MPDTDMEYLARAIGRAIAKHRTHSGLTQEDVAERLGIGNEAVSRIERGIVIPNIKRLAELARIFDCDTADLLTETSNRPEDQSSHINSLLAPLSHDDRQLVVELVERLAQRLQPR